MHAKWVDWGISAGGLLVFVLLAWQVHMDNSALVRFDEKMAAEAKEHAQDHPHLLEFARTVTHAGDAQVMTVLPILALLLLRRHPKLAVIWLLAALLAGTIIQHSKELVNRPRPDKALRDESVHETSASFPSGHATGSIIGYGAVAYVGVVVLRRRWAKVALTAMVVVLVLAIGWTRVYLRAHWCSDVLGGWALGLCWLSLCIAVVRVAWRAKDG